MWFMTDDDIATVLALVRLYVAQTARTWVVSHVQVRGKRKREVLTWDGIRTPPTYYVHPCGLLPAMAAWTQEDPTLTSSYM